LKVAGENLPRDRDRATVSRALQVIQQISSVWTKWRLNHFNALVGRNTGQSRSIIARNANASCQPLMLERTQPLKSLSIRQIRRA
jgi:hypothetical protein